jgi:hypothetical protein
MHTADHKDNSRQKVTILNMPVTAQVEDTKTNTLNELHSSQGVTPSNNSAAGQQHRHPSSKAATLDRKSSEECPSP